MIRFTVYAFLPLFYLVSAISSACFLCYWLLLASGDILPLDKIIGKLTLVLLILSIFPFKKVLQTRWTDIGFAPSQQFFAQLFKGLLLALATLLPVLFVLYWLGIQIFDETRHWTPTLLAEKTSLGLFFAFLIALNEEILFRGLLLTYLRQKMPLFSAIAISSIYYAGLHFLKSKTSIAYANLNLASSFQLMGEAFMNLLNPEIVTALTALIVVGIFLALLRVFIPHSLGLCIGCHCGWVWQIKVCKDIFNVNPHSDYLYLVSSYDGVIGPLVAVWLALASFCILLIKTLESGNMKKAFRFGQ